jgi:hypothetical protein
VRFVETPIFTEDIVELLPDEDYRTLQLGWPFAPKRPGSSGERRHPQAPLVYPRPR